MIRKVITLKRIAGNEDGNFGVIVDNNTPYEVTLEESWKNNQPFESCIPVGIYLCKKFYSVKFNLTTFHITDVPERENCIFHPGNTETDTEGCILIGTRFGHLIARDDDSGKIESQPAVLYSLSAFKRFMNRMSKYDEFVLQILTT